jgi:peptidoglycan/LPS O-acetylase OafA/YrhL
MLVGSGRTRTLRAARTSTLENLNLLRLVATYRVVIFHATCIAGDQWDADLLREALDLFPVHLDTFFVLSGFVLMVSLARQASQARDFLRRRFVRLVPLLWLTTTLGCALFATTSSNGGRAALTAATIRWQPAGCWYGPTIPRLPKCCIILTSSKPGVA